MKIMERTKLEGQKYFIISLILVLSLSFSPSLTSATDSFGYGTTDYSPIGTINNTYYNNTYINQTANATINETQFDSNDPISIKQSWLTSFIEAVSKWGNYWSKTENITGVDYIQTEIINFSGGAVYYNGTDNIWDFS
jgi:hypothetical protein